MKVKIQIKSIFGKVLFELEKENNTIKDTLIEAVNNKANLIGSDLSGSDLSGSNLSGSDLRGSDLSGSDLSGSNLSGSNLRYSNLSGSDLRGSNLSGSNLRYSNLIGSDLRYSNLSGSDLRGSDLSGAKNIDKALIPMYSKWNFSIKGDFLKIGCKDKSFEEWKDWFSNSKEKFETERDSEDFKRIKAMFLAHKAYYEFLK